MYSNTNMDIFISYSRRDFWDENNVEIPGNAVSRILSSLQKNNIGYWIDTEGKYDRDDFIKLISDKIVESKILLFISSRNSNESDWTKKEVTLANQYHKQIVPVRIDDTKFTREIELILANIDYIDYFKNPDRALEDLVLSVNRKLQQINNLENRETNIRHLKGEISILENEILNKRKEIDRSKLSISELIASYNANLQILNLRKKELKSTDESYDDGDFKEGFIKSFEDERELYQKQISALTDENKKLKKEIDRLNDANNTSTESSSNRNPASALFHLWFFLGLVANVVIIVINVNVTSRMIQTAAAVIWLITSVARLCNASKGKIFLGCLLFIAITILNFHFFQNYIMSSVDIWINNLF